MKIVVVYRSRRKKDTYLYLLKDQAFDALPDSLKQVFGEPEVALSMNLAPDKQLAHCSGEAVLTAIEEQGFYLQMPPRDGGGVEAVVEAIAREVQSNSADSTGDAC